MEFQSGESANLVSAHKPAETDHIGGENCRQAALLTFRFHRLPSLPAA
jgi:hypothetical protein